MITLLRGSKQAVTLVSKSSVRIEGDNVQVHLQLLFLRLIIAYSSFDDLNGSLAMNSAVTQRLCLILL